MDTIVIALYQIRTTHRLLIHFYAIKIVMKHVQKIAKNVVVTMVISGINISLKMQQFKIRLNLIHT
jgi:hypothetical protein